MSRPARFVPGFTHGCVTVLRSPTRALRSFALSCARCNARFSRSRQAMSALMALPPCVDCPACRPKHPGTKWARKYRAAGKVQWAERVPPTPGRVPNTGRCKRCEDMPWRRTDFAGKPLQQCLGCGKPYRDHEPLRSCGTASSALGGVCAVVW